MLTLDIQTFAGHLHPLIVHLAIGFLLLALFFELVSYLKKYQHLRQAVPFSMTLGFAAAVLACICGYMLSLSGDYDEEQLGTHKMAGILVAAVAGLLVLMGNETIRKRIPVPRAMFLLCCAALFATLIAAGHKGGGLTHGTDYLSLDVLTQREMEKPSSVEEAYLFEQVVHPILTKRCAACHRDGKKKGELSMATLEEIKKGGKSGPAVTGGKPDESELYNRISLDPSHEDFMPADGKTPLTPSEAVIIKWWIEKGMATDGKKIGEMEGGDEIKSEVAVFLDLDAISPADRAGVSPALPPGINLDSIRNKGISVRVMLHQPLMLDVTIPAGSDFSIDLIHGDLRAIAKNVIWLNASGLGLTEKDFDFLSDMNNLKKLRLERNPIGDDIVNRLTGLNQLESLNLNETKITRAGEEKLKKLPSLKRLYSWHTEAE